MEYAAAKGSFLVTRARKLGPACLGAMYLLGISVMLAGCSGDFFQEGYSQRKEADARNKVPPTDYKSDILAVARSYLNYPRKIRDAGITEPFLKEVGRGPERYIVCVRADAMNSDGKFTGSRARVAIFRRGKLDQFIEATPEPSSRGAGQIFAAPEAADPCAGVVYQPFPELEKLSSQPPG